MARSSVTIFETMYALKPPPPRKAALKQDFVGEPTQSPLDSFDVAGFLTENRQLPFGDPA